MAMNKKEQAMVDDLRKQLLLAKAFRRTDPVEPDVMPPGHSDPLKAIRKGWLPSTYLGNYGDWVSPACTSLLYHNPNNDDKTSTQGSRRLYSSKLLALKAARYSIECQCEAILAKIDAEIEPNNQGASR